MVAQPNGARKKRPCAKVGDLKIAIPYFVVRANLTAQVSAKVFL
jgi:hypothetical protein